MDGASGKTIVPLGLAAGEPGGLTELVRGSDRRLVERMTPLVRSRSVALDMGSVERIDAAGIAALISLYRSAREAGRSFAVIHASPRVAKVLAIVGLDRVLLSHNEKQNSHSGARLEKDAA
jgi:anti-anti-sigma factor